MAHYPVSLDLEDRKCVVVGGGSVAERKVATLIDFGADVTVVAPEVTDDLHKSAVCGSIEYVADVFSPAALDGAFLVIAATNDSEVNQAVYTEAERRGILVNVVDDPELCTFFTPSVVRRGELIISISTSGQSPTLCRSIRENLDAFFGPEYGDLVELMGELRAEVKAKHHSLRERHDAYLRILKSDVLKLLKEGKREQARTKAKQCI